MVGASIVLQKRIRSSISPGDGENRVDRDDNRLSTTLLDLNILDCPICYDALTIPIFQCDNGHLACSSCCPKLSNKCPACALPVGRIRCRAMESVLESVFVPCRNAKLGCTKNVSYGKQSTHEKECDFFPCSCPEQNCDYTGPYKELCEHYYNFYTHHNRYQLYWFTFGRSFTVLINISDKILILGEKKKKLLFAVQCFREPYGVYVTVSCIAPSSPQVGHFSWEISYTSADGDTMIYKSPKVKKILQVSFQTPEENFMLIPSSLVRYNLLMMKLCVNELNQE